jgi:hypothetical protein
MVDPASVNRGTSSDGTGVEKGIELPRERTGQVCDQGIVPPGDVYDSPTAVSFVTAADRLVCWALDMGVDWEDILPTMELVYREVARLALARAGCSACVRPGTVAEAASRIQLYAVRLEVARQLGNGTRIPAEELMEACRHAVRAVSERAPEGAVRPMSDKKIGRSAGDGLSRKATSSQSSPIGWKAA